MVKVSIITPCYNGEKYIEETIMSVKEQNYKDYEHILIDDCSKDNTFQLLQKHENERIKVFKNEKNLWIVWTRNKAIWLAKWEYICFLDQDDLWISDNKLNKQTEFLDENKNYVLLGSQVKFINEEWIDIKDTSVKYYCEDKDIRKHILQYNQFVTCSVMFRKDLLNKVWLLNKKYDKVDDYDLWLKLWTQWKLKNLDEIMVAYRKTWINTSRANKTFIKMKWMHLKLIVRYFKYYPNWIKALSFWLANLLIPYKLADYLRPIYLKIVGILH